MTAPLAVALPLPRLDLRVSARAATGLSGRYPLTSAVAAVAPPRRVSSRRLLLDAARLVLAAVRNDTHLAEDCQDWSCPRFGCRMYHSGFDEGWRRGYAQGYADGEAAGFAAGYAAGFSAGVASAAGNGG